jgi:hypothetical protein
LRGTKISLFGAGTKYENHRSKSCGSKVGGASSFSEVKGNPSRKDVLVFADSGD